MVLVELVDAATVVPIPSGAGDTARVVGQYQGITIDLETGRFYYDPHDWRQDPVVVKRRNLGTAGFPTNGWLPAGRRVRWVLDSGFDDTVTPPRPPYLDAAALTALLHELAPTMERFVDAMVSVPGQRGRWDWTTSAVATGWAIQRHVHRHRAAVEITEDPWIYDITEFADQFESFDDILRFRFAHCRLDQLSDGGIRDIAEQFGTGSLTVTRAFPDALEMFELKSAESRARFAVLGTSAYLHGIREASGSAP